MIYLRNYANEVVLCKETNRAHWKTMKDPIILSEQPITLKDNWKFVVNGGNIPNAKCRASLWIHGTRGEGDIVFMNNKGIRKLSEWCEEGIDFPNIKVSIQGTEDSKKVVEGTYQIFFMFEQLKPDGQKEILYLKLLAIVVFKAKELPNKAVASRNQTNDHEENNEDLELFRMGKIRVEQYHVFLPFLLSMTRVSENKIKKLIELEKVNLPDRSTENFEENLRRDISTDRQKFLKFLDQSKNSGKEWKRNQLPTQWIFEAWSSDFDELGKEMKSQAYFKMLKEEVVDSLDGWARKLGLCCSAVSKQVTRSYICNGGSGCEIRASETYFTREVDGVHTMLCKSHKYKSKMDGWTEHLNDEEDDEVRLRCRKCKRYAHVICSLFDVTRSPELFLCKRCLVDKCEPILATKALGKSKLATHMMATLNPFFITIGCENTTVALLSSGHCDGVVQNTKLRKWFKAVNAPEANPFIYKHIGVFQNRGDGSDDVQVFHMIVHEYVCGDKKGSVHLHYLDSNDHFWPFTKKGVAYRKIISAYWIYAESVGFVDCHIHACPPQKGDSYLFWGHPKSQHYTTDKQLTNFYAKTIDEAKENHNIVGVHSKFDLTKHDSIASIVKKLYTEAGLWQKLIVSHLEKKKWNSEEILESFKKFVKNSLVAHEDYLFWVDIRKKTVRKIDNIKILDQDEMFPSSFANTRDNLIDKQLEYNLQFDTVRTATYSTRMMLILLQQERKNLKRRQQAKRKCREDID